MALMTPIVGNSINPADRAELFDRCLRAAQVCWLVEDFEVFMPVFDSPESIELRGILQSIGLTVMNGLNDASFCNLSKQEKKIAIFHVNDWHTSTARKAALAMQTSCPNAIFCVVTGLLPLPDSVIFQCQPAFEDARALLQTAGIGFFCFEGGVQ